LRRGERRGEGACISLAADVIAAERILADVHGSLGRAPRLLHHSLGHDPSGSWGWWKILSCQPGSSLRDDPVGN